MFLLHYVDDLVIATTSLKIRDLFLAHINKKWKTTAEGKLNRYLGINYSWDEAKCACTATATAYIDRIAIRFGLEETRLPDSPMDAGFEMIEDYFNTPPTEKMVGWCFLLKDKSRGAVLVHLRMTRFYLLDSTETTVMVVTTIDWHQISKIAEEKCFVGKQFDLVVRGRGVGIHHRHTSTGFAVCLEEKTLTVVDDDITNFWKVHGMNRMIEVRSVGFARRLVWHRAWRVGLVEIKFDVRIM